MRCSCTLLHDIELPERPRIASELSRIRVKQGKIFVRGPLRFISREEIRQLLQQTG